MLVEYFGWIFISGRMWWTACATAIADSAKPVAISLSFPLKVVMSPAAQTASIEVRITGHDIEERWANGAIEVFDADPVQHLRGLLGHDLISP